MWGTNFKPLLNSFNRNISDWVISNVTEMIFVVHNAIRFNGDISECDVSNVDYMNYMFNGATAFLQDISDWNVANVIE